MSPRIGVVFGGRAPTRRRRSSIRRDVAVTGAAQLSVAVGGLLLYRLIAMNKGAAGVAQYTLVKQVVVFFLPVVILGMQTAIPRYVALCSGTDDRPESYLLAAIATTGAATGVVCALILAWPHGSASLLFGSSSRTSLLVPLAATLVATLAVEVVAGYFRGHLEFAVSAVLRIVGVAALPVVFVLALPDDSMATLILLMALALIALCAVAIAIPLARAFAPAARKSVPAATRTLLNYGSRRVPGDLAAVALWAVTPVVAAHYVPLRQVAFLGAGLQVLNVVAMAFQPIGLIFLPVLTRLWVADRERARWYASQLSAAAVHLALFATPQILLFADVAARGWLGPSFDEAGPIIRLTVFPVAFYICSIVLRSPLDAVAVTAYNSRNRLAGLAVAVVTGTLLLSLGVGDSIEAVALGFSSGLLAVGVLTFLTTRRIYAIPRSAWASWTALLLGVVTAAIGAAVRFLVVGSHASLPALALVVVLEGLLATGFVVGLARSGVEWPAEFRARLLRR
jgi:O-antigen/teichoic acid export membrane protein